MCITKHTSIPKNDGLYLFGNTFKNNLTDKDITYHTNKNHISIDESMEHSMLLTNNNNLQQFDMKNPMQCIKDKRDKQENKRDKKENKRDKQEHKKDKQEHKRDKQTFLHKDLDVSIILNDFTFDDHSELKELMNVNY